MTMRIEIGNDPHEVVEALNMYGTLVIRDIHEPTRFGHILALLNKGTDGELVRKRINEIKPRIYALLSAHRDGDIAQYEELRTSIQHYLEN